MKILKQVQVPEKVEEGEPEVVKKVNVQVEKDPLASTEEEDPAAMIVKIDLKEIDRLLYHVQAIDQECHIIPQGAMKLTVTHEVYRNEAFIGLPEDECFKLNFYSHFRNV